jgi:uncharacterized protein
MVIGAGPAGLSAAAELAASGTCLLLEEGAPARERSRTDAVDQLAGVGGAGLFSDGKHSFFPAASALWGLPDREALEGAFAATSALLAQFSVPSGPLPKAVTLPAPQADTWVPKAYPSIYVSLADRFAIIEELLEPVTERWCGARVVGARREDSGIVVAVAHGDGHTERVRAESVVVAGGRWSPPAMRGWLERDLGVRFAFLRVEVGVRIEVSSDDALFARLPGVDGKLRFVDAARGIEIRTFCTCRKGEIVLGEAAGLRAFSGRADGPPSDRSNVGLLVRSRDAALGSQVMRALAQAEPVSFGLDAWRDDARLAAQLMPLMGEVGAGWLARARDTLLSYAPSLAHANGRVVAPAIEGVGDYPVDDGSLQLAPGVWVAGDACGRFRGIVAAMVSGRYVARRINQTLG